MRRDLISTLAFFALSYAISWWPSLLEPHSILPLGPLIAALVVLAATSGRAGVADLLRRSFDVRVAPRWYAIALGVPFLVTAAAAGAHRLLGAEAPAVERIPPLSAAPISFLSVFVLVGLGEEPAWRGFALPRLTRLLPLLAGVLTLTVLHALWHLPLFGSEYNRINGVPWFLGLAAYTVGTAWLYQRTEGNLLLPSLAHTAVNVSAQYFFAPLSNGPDGVRLWWLWAAAWWLAAIAPLLLLARERDLRSPPR
jgi:membrane protease YdiL (CAAX protease family)